ncbi:ABC transporter permease [Fundicoccus culcitae]|uniref:ABC transporter permease n=1 Tax=Fundicoccus culcitae TaxID=2969821 RepID=A0ABY5P8F0_9LACT|nr:ABC transporter permease [Fundicoccus culcitae]UUX34745.1 ABC transporter permease [Fundicoccus culcitae]
MTIKNIWRLTLREMTSNWLRFCMILAIIFLGVGIFIGILNTGSSLQLSVERYLNNVNAQDLVVYATYGLNDEDLATLKKAEGINAYPIQTVEAQIADAFIKVIPTTESINQPQIVEGSLPIQANEIALDRVLIDLYPDLKLGETMTLNTDQSTALLGLPTLQNTSFKIVGIVESPLYLLGRQRGYTNDGAHSLSGFAVVNPSAITGTRYSEIAVTLNDYATDPSVTILKAELESLLESRPAAALQELKKTLTPYQQSANLFRAILPNWHNEMNLDIDQLEEPTYMVNERSSLMGYQAIDSFIKQIRRIAFLFGALFFAVALLVTYAVLSQLLNDRRNTMGTLSALGYLKREIKFIYVIYAFIVSVLGCLLGYACGTWFIPRMILGILPYFVVKERVVYWNHRDLLVTLGVVLLATIGTTLILINRQMKDKTANLLLAKMPKQGNHIWIEHFPIIWNKISFKWKISIRNLYRYLPRNLMTIMGMMGCTVLIVVGFGMLNTIKATGQRQYTYIQTFDGSVPIDAQTASALTNTSAIQTFVPINQ